MVSACSLTLLLDILPKHWSWAEHRQQAFDNNTADTILASARPPPPRGGNLRRTGYRKIHRIAPPIATATKPKSPKLQNSNDSRTSPSHIYHHHHYHLVVMKCGNISSWMQYRWDDAGNCCPHPFCQKADVAFSYWSPYQLVCPLLGRIRQT